MIESTENDRFSVLFCKIIYSFWKMTLALFFRVLKYPYKLLLRSSAPASEERIGA